VTEPTGRAKGGVARALTAERHSQIARNAALAKAAGPLVKATQGSLDHPLRIGDIEIPCYVLEDETRVLSQRGLQGGMGMSLSGSRAGEQRMAVFVDSVAAKGIPVKDLPARTRNPIRFVPSGGGNAV
jgi:hypothetical protein